MLHFAYFLEEFRGIPPREPPISGTRVTTNWAGERPTRHCQVRICTPFPAVSLFVLLSFLLPVRALLCGRLPHTSLPSLTTSLIINCISARLNCNGTFQCRSINESANPRRRSSDESGGVAQLGVSRRGRGFVVCASRSLRGAKRHRTAALFRVSVASHLPARVAIVGLICAMASAALPASDRRNSTSVISCLARGGCWVVIKKKVRFLLRCASA